MGSFYKEASNEKSGPRWEEKLTWRNFVILRLRCYTHFIPAGLERSSTSYMRRRSRRHMPNCGYHLITSQWLPLTASLLLKDLIDRHDLNAAGIELQFIIFDLLVFFENRRRHR